MAATARRAMSVDSARTTGIIPIAVSRLMTSALSRDFMMTSFQLLAGHARAGALHEPFLDFGQGCHGGVARGGHGQGPVCGPAVQRPLRRSAREETVDQPGGERISTADPIEDSRSLRKVAA